MTGSSHRALLGRLAADLGWFSQNGEVTATHALGVLLEQEPLREALVRMVSDLSGANLADVDSFYNEIVHEDKGRTDLEGHDAEGLRMVVEAKFAAPLGPGQLKAYLKYLTAAAHRGVGCALVVLVPASREQEVSAVIRQAKAGLESDTPEVASIPAIVITWDRWLECWEHAARAIPGLVGAAILGDLVQLRELCLTLQGLYMMPFGEAAAGRTEWRHREDDFHRLVDEVTVALSDRSRSILPIQRDATLEFTHRYISGGADSYCSVGVAGAFADNGAPPLWLRYHKRTSGFRTIKDRIVGSRFRSEVDWYDGHLWLPLRTPENVGGSAIAEDLVSQVRAIRAVASPTQSVLDSPLESAVEGNHPNE